MSGKTIKVFNPRTLMRDGASAFFEAAANPDAVVLFRAGRLWSPLPDNMVPRVTPADDRPLKRPMVRVDTNHGTAAYGNAGTKVYRLVEVTEEEIMQMQIELDDQSGFDTTANNG